MHHSRSVSQIRRSKNAQPARSRGHIISRQGAECAAIAYPEDRIQATTPAAGGRNAFVLLRRGRRCGDRFGALKISYYGQGGPL